MHLQLAGLAEFARPVSHGAYFLGLPFEGGKWVPPAEIPPFLYGADYSVAGVVTCYAKKEKLKALIRT